LRFAGALHAADDQAALACALIENSQAGRRAHDFFDDGRIGGRRSEQDQREHY
jgi:hypothetical protein